MDIAGVPAATGKAMPGLRENLDIRKVGRTTRSACIGKFARLIQITPVVSCSSCSTVKIVYRGTWKREYP